VSDTARAIASIPRFNHVALSVPPELVAGENAADILRFYEEVFRWGPMPTMVKDGELLVLRVHSNEQFVYLHGSADPLRCPTSDHFGLQVERPEDLDAVLERARLFQAQDDRVEISERQTEDFKVLHLHSVYIRYLLPMSIELQCFDWQPGFDAARTA
jgi:hypothetical protein